MANRNTDNSHGNRPPPPAKADAYYSAKRDAKMPITTVPNVVHVGNLPQGIQKTGATNNG